jgi:hypothetical protein
LWAGPPAFVAALLGNRSNGKPNTSDAANAPSVAIARMVNELVGVPHGQPGPPDPGARFERAVRDWLDAELTAAAPSVKLKLSTRRSVAEFIQYRHLSRLQEIILGDATNTLKVEIGADYVIHPDVTIGVMRGAREFLHASVSCKWTCRSDRVQNVRHEAIILTRHRRGRQPHIVVVTAEPLPSRIASIARGTGEIDAAYHIALPFLQSAVDVHGSAGQRAILAELAGEERLLDITDMPAALAP